MLFSRHADPKLMWPVPQDRGGLGQAGEGQNLKRIKTLGKWSGVAACLLRSRRHPTSEAAAS